MIIVNLVLTQVTAKNICKTVSSHQYLKRIKYEQILCRYELNRYKKQKYNSY